MLAALAPLLPLEQFLLQLLMQQLASLVPLAPLAAQLAPLVPLAPLMPLDPLAPLTPPWEEWLMKAREPGSAAARRSPLKQRRKNRRLSPTCYTTWLCCFEGALNKPHIHVFSIQ